MHPTVVPLPVSVRRSPLARRAAAVVRPFWVVPALWCALAVTLGLVVPYVELTRLTDWLPGLFPGGTDGARTVLSTIAGAMISVTGLVFSVTMIVLQLASSQYTPRVLQTFLEDRITQHTLGLFAASFVHALAVLRSVEGREGVPQLSITISFAFVLAALAIFLAFIHHITRAVGVADLLQRTAQQCRRLLTDGQAAGWPQVPPELPRGGATSVVVAPRSGYLDRIHVPSLARAARDRDVHLEVLHPLGAFVVEGSPLLRVHGTGGTGAPVDTEELLEAVMVVGERTMDQDVGYGVRRLVDVAERALSPGINDPTTAVQVLDQLHDLVRRMVTSPATWPVWSDPDGTPRVVLRQPSVADVVEAAFGDIAHWGAEHRRVTERIDEIRSELRVASLDEHRPGLG